MIALNLDAWAAQVRPSDSDPLAVEPENAIEVSFADPLAVDPYAAVPVSSDSDPLAVDASHVVSTN